MRNDFKRVCVISMSHRKCAVAPCNIWCTPTTFNTVKSEFRDTIVITNLRFSINALALIDFRRWPDHTARNNRILNVLGSHRRLC